MASFLDLPSEILGMIIANLVEDAVYVYNLAGDSIMKGRTKTDALLVYMSDRARGSLCSLARVCRRTRDQLSCVQAAVKCNKTCNGATHPT